MDFFAQQERARQDSFRLLLLYLLALAFVVLGVDLAVALTWLVFFRDGPSQTGLVQALLQVPGRVYLTTSMVCGLTILAGSLYRILELAEGGEKVARLLGGRKVDPESADKLERRLLNIVEEMALAAATPLPAVYVLDSENDINAFAAGWTPHDAAVGVSRGALRLLTRDELQGVLAHEFGHVLNGDMRLNTLMAGVLHGLLVVALVGDWMVGRNRTRHLWSSAAGDSTSRGITGLVSLGITVLGLAIVLLGYLGVFFGRLIQAAVSRQRELLADASAVQFTRNPDGIGRALRKIGGTQPQGSLSDWHVTPFSHLFFNGGQGGFFSRLTATHPPLRQRIDAIYGGQLMPFITVVLNEEPDFSASSQTDASLPQAALAGQITDVRSSLATPLQQAMTSEDGASALILALLLAEPATAARQAQLATLDTQRASLVEELARSVSGRSSGSVGRLALLDLAMPTLKQLAAPERRELIETAARFAVADGSLNVPEFALLTVLENRLPPNPKPRVKQSYVSLANRFDEVRLVLSLVAHSGKPATSAAAYAKASEFVGLPLDATLLPQPAVQLGAVRTAMLRLNQLLPMQKQTLIKAFTLCVTSDARIEPLEADILRAVCVSLDVPLPQPIS